MFSHCSFTILLHTNTQYTSNKFLFVACWGVNDPSTTVALGESGAAGLGGFGVATGFGASILGGSGFFGCFPFGIRVGTTLSLIFSQVGTSISCSSDNHLWVYSRCTTWMDLVLNYTTLFLVVNPYNLSSCQCSQWFSA